MDRLILDGVGPLLVLVGVAIIDWRAVFNDLTTIGTAVITIGGVITLVAGRARKWLDSSRREKEAIERAVDTMPRMAEALNTHIRQSARDAEALGYLLEAQQSNIETLIETADQQGLDIAVERVPRQVREYLEWRRLEIARGKLPLIPPYDKESP